MSALVVLCLASFILSGHTEAMRERRQQAQNVSAPLLSGNETDKPGEANSQDNDPDKTNKCGPDYCELFNLCLDGTVCVTTPECLYQCVLNGSTIPEIFETTATSLPSNDTTMLRPYTNRTCQPNSPFQCKHGIIKGCSQSMTCYCDEGWTGLFCTIPCTLSCGEHGECIFADDLMFCNCKHQYVGERCENLIPDTEERQRILAAVLSSSLAFVLILAIVIPIIMWKKRVIFVMKLIYVFKEYEDDDGKLFDAYVSMTPTSNAEKFVRESLQPMLENRSFKLYIQARDTLAGEVMSEAILSAIEGSRRTIMIVTRDYISNEWNRFEYLIAQHETLKLHQRIIPIILEDIDKEYDNMDKSLKHILNSIKCLKFPQDQTETMTVNSVELSEDIQSPDSNSSANSATYFYKSGRIDRTTSSVYKDEKQMFEKKVAKFWKRLILTMPKKKNKESESVNAGAMLSKHTSYDVSTRASENNSNLKHGNIECNKSFILDFNYEKNCVNDIPDDKFEIKILNPYNGEET